MTDNTMREAFEKWAKMRVPYRALKELDDEGEYDDQEVRMMWCAWQAAQSVPVDVELVALRKDAERYRWLRDSPDSPIINIGYATDKMVDAAMQERQS